jgi:hypothetical protein
MCPTDRGNDPTVDSNELERVGRDGNGPAVDSNKLERVDRDGNGPLHDDQSTLVQNPRRTWKRGDGVIKDGLVLCKSEMLTI